MEVQEDYSFKNPVSEIKKAGNKVSKINNEMFAPIISLYKNYLDKCQLVSIGSNSFKKMLNSTDSLENSKSLLNLTEYALSFLVSMDLYLLAKSMNSVSRFF